MMTGWTLPPQLFRMRALRSSTTSTAVSAFSCASTVRKMPSNSVTYPHSELSPRAFVLATVIRMSPSPIGAYVMTLEAGEGRSEFISQVAVTRLALASTSEENASPTRIAVSENHASRSRFFASVSR